jgi:membrane protein YdbS with pleckstrin-like domain
MQLSFSETYAQSLLASGEQIIRNQRQHWFGLLYRLGMGVLALLIAAGCFLLSGWFTGDGLFGSIRTILGIAALVFLLIGIGHISLSYFRWENDRDVLTTRRIIQTQGFINRKAADTSLEKINDAVFEQGVIGRVFGFGALDVMTASASGINKMRFLTTPMEFKKDMMDAKHNLEMGVASGEFTDAPLRVAPVVTGSAVGSRDVQPETLPVGDVRVPPDNPAPAPIAPAPPPAPAAAVDVTDQIAKLAGLRDSGAITPEEYEAKKSELLGRI